MELEALLYAAASHMHSTGYEDTFGHLLFCFPSRAFMVLAKLVLLTNNWEENDEVFTMRY
jgi:hypothetical protein